MVSNNTFYLQVDLNGLTRATAPASLGKSLHTGRHRCRHRRHRQLLLLLALPAEQ